MKIIDCTQGSLEWKQARCGRITGSRIVDVLAYIRSGEAAARRDYRTQLVCEILTGEPEEDGYLDANMQWGTAHEADARASYSQFKGLEVAQVGFVLHPSLKRSGTSPDGLVEGGGLVEIKCPKKATHLNYLMEGAVPTKYKAQMTWQMMCCERDWCDFVSYDPRFPKHLQLFVIRYHLELQRVTDIKQEVNRFNEELDAVLFRLDKLKKGDWLDEI